jgi:hypothetical protein
LELWKNANADTKSAKGTYKGIVIQKEESSNNRCMILMNEFLTRIDEEKYNSGIL